jgi:FAD dependent oxidoreductase
MRKQERIILFCKRGMKGTRIVASSLLLTLWSSHRACSLMSASVGRTHRHWDRVLLTNQRRSLYSTPSKTMEEESAVESPLSIRILGGGMAGLSLAYHLLASSSNTLKVTIVDVEAGPGTGGASAVAGGYVCLFIYGSRPESMMQFIYLLLLIS